MAWGLLEHLLEPDHLDELFARTAERNYHKELFFSTLINLFGKVVLRVEPSVHAADPKREAELGGSAAALYRKLNRVELGLSEALVSDSARRSQELIASLKAAHAPWPEGYRCRVLDGNYLGPPSTASRNRGRPGPPRCRVGRWSYSTRGGCWPATPS